VRCRRPQQDFRVSGGDAASRVRAVQDPDGADEAHDQEQVVVPDEQAASMTFSFSGRPWQVIG
jgi:hypothetical protein